MNAKYKITVCSLPDYEDLVSEIYIDGKFIGLLSQEEKRGEFMIELDASVASSAYRLSEFMDIVSSAARKLSAVG